MNSSEIPVIFLVQSTNVDASVLRVTTEASRNCIIYTFFDLKEIMNYMHLEPNIIIADADLIANNQTFTHSISKTSSRQNLKYILLTAFKALEFEIYQFHLLTNSIVFNINKNHFSIVEKIDLLLTIQQEQELALA